LANWLDVLKNDKNAILRASSKAQAAADHIMGRDQIEYAKAA
jgi:antirestriction protein ArdC